MKMASYYWLLALKIGGMVSTSHHGQEKTRALSLKPAKLIIAHRGAPTEAPENTLPSFAAAVDAGCDALELDIRQTLDKAFVVLHDESLVRTSDGIGSVAQIFVADFLRLRARQLGKDVAPIKLSLLKDVLAAFPAAAFNVDIKAANLEDLAGLLEMIHSAQDEALKRYGCEQEVLLTSASEKIQRELDRLAPDPILRGMSRKDVIRVLAGAYFGHWLVPKRLYGRACQVPLHLRVAGIRFAVVTSRVVALLKHMGSPLHVWPDDSEHMVDDPELALKLYARGIDGIFTNKVRLMVHALRGAKGSGGREVRR